MALEGRLRHVRGESVLSASVIALETILIFFLLLLHGVIIFPGPLPAQVTET
jgi:hypothetical protein